MVVEYKKINEKKKGKRKTRKQIEINTDYNILVNIYCYCKDNVLSIANNHLVDGFDVL